MSKSTLARGAGILESRGPGSSLPRRLQPGSPLCSSRSIIASLKTSSLRRPEKTVPGHRYMPQPASASNLPVIGRLPGGMRLPGRNVEHPADASGVVGDTLGAPTVAVVRVVVLLGPVRN